MSMNSTLLSLAMGCTFVSLELSGLVNVEVKRINGDIDPYLHLGSDKLTIGVNGVQVVVALDECKIVAEQAHGKMQLHIDWPERDIRIVFTVEV